jgi:CDP-diacylglycerol--glycerol-3-phosphate 3-phosphatidyltransferase
MAHSATINNRIGAMEAMVFFEGEFIGRSGVAFAGLACVFRRRPLRFNLPNILTLSRVPAMFIIVALMYSEFHWAATIAFWLFVAAALTDWLDGKLARESGQVSTFGRFMDAVIDKVMVLGVMIALVNGEYFFGHRIPAMIALLCILCREFMISGLRMVAASKGVVVEADAGGKLKTFIQMNAIGWLLGSRMFLRDFGDLFAGEEHWWVTASNWGGIWLFLLSALLTVTSGITYFRRHGHVVMD